MATALACYSACNAGAVTCYAASGFVFGTVTAGAGAPPAVLACNAALSTCTTACMTTYVPEGLAIASAGAAAVTTPFWGTIAVATVGLGGVCWYAKTFLK